MGGRAELSALQLDKQGRAEKGAVSVASSFRFPHIDVPMRKEAQNYMRRRIWPVSLLHILVNMQYCCQIKLGLHAKSKRK